MSSRTEPAALAVHGGKPTRAALLPYGHQQIDDDDIRAVTEVLRSDWITTGPKVGEFEDAVAARVGAKFAAAFSSGTAALHAAAFAAGVGPGDEAVTTPLTFCATSNCVLYNGGMPVFADVSPDTLNLDPEETSQRITPKTKVLIPVDYAGHPADLNAFAALADRHGLTIIEDASHALGAEYQGKAIGGISLMTVFSFHPVKHITTGEGGMVTTSDPKLAQKLRRFRNHGIDSDARQRQLEGGWMYRMIELGYNYRLSDINCALGLSQLHKLDANLARRRGIAARYNDAFSRLPAVIVPRVRADAIPAWHLYPLRLDLPRLRAGRAEVFSALRAENIGVNVHYIPVHLHPYYRDRFGFKDGEFPVAEGAYEALISLPMFHAMSDADVEDVTSAVRKVVGFYLR